MDIGKTFGFVFEDKDWVSKLLIGSVILAIPIFGIFALMGYAIALIRSVKANASRPLPDWQNLGGYFVDGLMFWIATLLYTLPLWILMCPIGAVWVLPMFAAEQEELMAILAGISGIVSMGLGCLVVLYGILLMLLTPVLQIRYAESGEIGGCLRFGEVFRFLLANIGPIIISQVLLFVIATIVMTALSTVIGALNFIPICGQILGLVLSFLMLPATVWLMLLSAHMYGQIARQAEMSRGLA